MFNQIHVTATEITDAVIAAHSDPTLWPSGEIPTVAEYIEYLRAEGTPVIQVIVRSDGYRSCIALVCSGLKVGGCVIPSIEDLWPRVEFRAKDGRLAPSENARRLLNCRFRGVEVPIEWVDVR